MIPEVLSLLNKGVESTIFLVVLAFKVFSVSSKPKAFNSLKSGNLSCVAPFPRAGRWKRFQFSVRLTSTRNNSLTCF